MAVSGAITLSMSPTSLSLSAGGSASSTASIGRTSYTGSVSLTVMSTLPSGVTSSVTNPGTGNSGSVSFTRSTNSATFSNYAVRIRASGSDVTSVEDTVYLSMAVSGAITLSMSPTSLSLSAGGSASSTASIGRTSYTGSVSLTVMSTLPSGVTSSVTNPGTGNSGSVSFTRSTNSATFSNHAVRIRASGSNVTSVEDTVYLSMAVSGAITLSMSPTSLSLSAGGSASSTASIGRTSYTGSVSLTVMSTLPSGVTSSVTNPGTGNSGSVSFTRSTNSATFSNHAVRIRASGSNVTSVEQIIYLNMAVSGAITLSMSPTSLSLSAGGSASSTASISRTSYTGSVSLTVMSTLPSGVTSSVTNPGTGNSGSVSFTRSTNSATFSNHAVRIRASGSNVTSVEQIIYLNMAVSGAITLSMSPTSLSLSAGGSASSTASISRTSYTGSVSLTVMSTLPSGVTSFQSEAVKQVSAAAVE
jgi:hypothetical protein